MQFILQARTYKSILIIELWNFLCLKVEDTTMDGRSIQTIFHLKSENTLVENQVQPWGPFPPPTFADSVSGSMKTGERKYPRLCPQNKS